MPETISGLSFQHSPLKQQGGIMYSPKIDENQIRRLYRLKHKTKKTIAQMVREAVEEYLKKQKEEKPNEKRCSEKVARQSS